MALDTEMIFPCFFPVCSHLHLPSSEVLQGEQKSGLSRVISMQTTMVVVKTHCKLSVKCNLFICGVKLKRSLTQCCLFLCAVQFSSLKTETERIQADKEQLQAELLAGRTELDGLRLALSHVQNTNKALTSDKVNPVSLFLFNE